MGLEEKKKENEYIRVDGVIIHEDTFKMIQRISEYYKIDENRALEIAVRSFFIHKEIWPRKDVVMQRRLMPDVV